MIHSQAPDHSAPPANAGLLAEHAAVMVPLESVKIYIDPLDATDEFTKGNYEAVLMLIGIVVDAKPYAGVCLIEWRILAVTGERQFFE